MNPHTAQIQHEMTKYKTSHVLHLILSVLSGGAWVIIWILVAISNSSAMSSLEAELQYAAEDETYVPTLSHTSFLVWFLVMLIVLFVIALFSKG